MLGVYSVEVRQALHTATLVVQVDIDTVEGGQSRYCGFPGRYLQRVPIRPLGTFTMVETGRDDSCGLRTNGAVALLGLSTVRNDARCR